MFMIAVMLLLWACRDPRTTFIAFGTLVSAFTSATFSSALTSTEPMSTTTDYPSAPSLAPTSPDSAPASASATAPASASHATSVAATQPLTPAAD